MKTKKNVALEKLINKTPSNPATFEQERPGHEAVSTLHWPKYDILAFFKFLQKKVSRHDKIIFCTYCMNLEVFLHD